MKTKEELIIQLLYTGNITLSEAFILMDKTPDGITFHPKHGNYYRYYPYKDYTSSPTWVHPNTVTCKNEK